MVLANQKTCPPSLFELTTLITYLFSFLLFACLACHRACLCSPTVALTIYPTRCVGSSTYVILSFLIFFVLCNNRFDFVFTKVFFTSPPLGLVTHSSLLSFFDYPFHLPDLLQSACFSACLLLFLCCLWPLRNPDCLCLGQLELKLV